MPDQTLVALQESSEKNKALYSYFEPRAQLLEWFPAPISTSLSITIDTDEFTCLCPKTGQPDYASIHIEYVPNGKCVESKSLKLYLMSFRMYGTFHEQCTQMICDDLVALLEPKWIRVEGRFAPRGGIAFVPTATWGER